MLRASDLLLTLSALCLLIAALKSSAKSSRFVIQASAAAADMQRLSSDMNGGEFFASSRPPAGGDSQRVSDDQTRSFEHWMGKIRRNLDSNSKRKLHRADQANKINHQAPQQQQQQRAQNFTQDDQVRGVRDSYNYYADEASNSQPASNQNQQLPADSATRQQQVSQQYRQAHEVKVDFLRRSNAVGAPNQLDATNTSRDATQNTTASTGTTTTTTNTLYLLNYNLLPQTGTLKTDLGLAEASLPARAAESNELFDSSEQQQPPPFTMFPPMQQPGQGGPSQLQQQHQIRQMLSNYQRYPQARQALSDHQRQLLTQLQPVPPELHLRPPTQAPASGGLANSQQGQPQQPLSPLQLLAGPFQAFLPPALGGSSGQPAANLANQPQTQTLRPATNSKHDDGKDANNVAKTPAAPVASQQPNPFGAFLNPFNLQPPAPPASQSSQPANDQQPPAAGQAGAMPNLQNFYQQLPLYQALLAARQRQEALQAAQKMREQQHAGAGNQPGNQAFGLVGQPLGGTTQQQQHTPQGGVPVPPPFAQTPFAGFGLPAQGLQQQQQQPGQLAGNPLGQNYWQPQPQPPQQATPPYSTPLLQPPSQTPPQPSAPHQNPAGNGAVHFDDDQQNNQQPHQPNHDNQHNPHQQQQQQQPIAQVNGNQIDHGNNNNNSNNEDQNNNQDDENQNDHNNNDQSNQNQGHNQDQGGQEQDNNQGNRPTEEEDPDLKSFQNLANGGDSFTDLFPKGILSDGDINEIKTQQAEQAKKQEEEERQKHLRQQQQQQQQQPQDQQYNNPVANQFAGNNQQNGNYPNNQQPNYNQQQQQQQNQNDNNQAEPEQQDGGNQDENDQQDDGNQGDGGSDGGDGGGNGEDGGGDGGGQEEDSPTAAALTAKSASNEKPKGRWTNSPGVEYAKKP